MASEEQIKELEEYYRSRLPAWSPDSQARAIAVAQQDRPLARLMGNAAPILARLMAGEKPKDVAASMGISRVALNAWLLTHAAEEWRAIASGKALERKEDAEDELDAASDQLGVAKGRERARVASWTLERLVPKLYGQPGKDGPGGVQITVNVDRSIGGEITVEQTPE